MELQPSAIVRGRSIFWERMGNPASWTGDWRRQGRYLSGAAQRAINAALAEHRALIEGLSIRRIPSAEIAEVFAVSREAIDRRLRPCGLKNPPGQVGRPRQQLP